MYYVYTLRSISNPQKIYVGFTISIEHRLEAHNDGKSNYISKYIPWTLLGHTAF